MQERDFSGMPFQSTHLAKITYFLPPEIHILKKIIQRAGMPWIRHTAR